MVESAQPDDPGSKERPTPYRTTLVTAPLDYTPFSGIDAVEITRIALALQRWERRFLDRVYTEAEQRYCGRNTQRLAGRFAAKEAISKVLGTGVGAIGWHEMEILPDVDGRPRVWLTGHAADLATRLGFGDISLSITHTGNLAMAFALAIGRSR